MALSVAPAGGFVQAVQERVAVDVAGHHGELDRRCPRGHTAASSGTNAA